MECYLKNYFITCATIYQKKEFQFVLLVIRYDPWHRVLSFYGVLFYLFATIPIVFVSCQILILIYLFLEAMIFNPKYFF